MRRINIVLGVMVLILVSSVSIIPLSTEGNRAVAYPGTPWCDMYGFRMVMYGSYMNTWNSKTYGSEICSDIMYEWNQNDPSAHWSRCATSPAWQGTAYCNETYKKPEAYLNGNGMFVFHGHSSQYRMVFWKWLYSEDASYVSNTKSHPASGSSIYIEDSKWDIDRMAFAYLGGCKTAMGESDNCAWWWRCVKGVDIVIGFDKSVYTTQHAEFIENFFKRAIHNHFPVRDAANDAFANVVLVFFANTGGIESCEIWGCHQYHENMIDYPHWGIEEV